MRTRPQGRHRPGAARRGLATLSDAFCPSLLTKVPKAAHGIVATFVRTIFAQPDAESVRAQHARTVEQLQPRFREAARMLR